MRYLPYSSWIWALYCQRRYQYLLFSFLFCVFLLFLCSKIMIYSVWICDIHIRCFLQTLYVVWCNCCYRLVIYWGFVKGMTYWFVHYIESERVICEGDIIKLWSLPRNVMKKWWGVYGVYIRFECVLVFGLYGEEIVSALECVFVCAFNERIYWHIYRYWDGGEGYHVSFPYWGRSREIVCGNYMGTAHNPSCFRRKDSLFVSHVLSGGSGWGHRRKSGFGSLRWLLRMRQEVLFLP